MKKLIMALFILANVAPAFGWENKVTHRTLSEYAVVNFFDPDFLDEELVQGTVKLKVRNWIQEGAEHEDDGTKLQFLEGTARSLNHFHVPTVTNPAKATLETAGLSDRATGMSAVLWAQTGAYQNEMGWDDWSWGKVREHEYNYLTSLNKTDEDANLSKMLMGLGYQMHLLQDMSQPAHVRNNTHIRDGAGWGGLETWTAGYDRKMRQLILDKTSVPPVSVELTPPFDSIHNLAPVARLFDTRTYLGTSIPTMSMSQGLSEYTNGNFFSEDTIFAAERYGNTPSYKYYFPYPRKDGTNMQDYLNRTIAPIQVTELNGKNVTSTWIKKIGDEANNIEGVDHLVEEGPLTRGWQYLAQLTGSTVAWYLFYGSFELDEQCFMDYAGKLLPRAVAYSDAMLDYFYRGALTVTVATPPTNGSISLKVRNNTPNETMDGGSVDLMVIFRQYSTNGTASGTLSEGDWQFRRYSYAGCTRDNRTCTISSTDTTFNFDLSENPLPPLAHDIALVLVYRGKLGNEQDSVAFSEVQLDEVAGDIGLSLPTRGVYATVGGESISNTFNNFSIAAQNSSATTIGAGNTQVLITYRKAQGDPFTSSFVDSSDEIYFTSATIPDQGISGAATDLPTFSLAAGIPVDATNVYAYLIHTDNVGKVTYGYRDISEPTPIDIVNNMDHVCINGNYLVAGSQEAIDAVGTDGSGRPKWDIFPHRLKDVFVSFSSSPPSATNYSAKFSDIEPGAYGRLFVLADYDFKFSSSVTVGNIDGPLTDVWGWGFETTTYPITGVFNQLAYENGQYIDYYPDMYTERGLKSWWYNYFENPEWPNGTSCDSTTASPNLAGPAAVEFPQ